MNLCLHTARFFHKRCLLLMPLLKNLWGRSLLLKMFSRSWKSGARPKMNGRNFMRQRDRRVCFYCLNPGHLISDCKEWNKKNVSPKAKSAKATQTLPALREAEGFGYKPFILNGQVSVSNSQLIPISILRDTGSCQSFILESALLSRQNHIPVQMC